MIDRRTFLASSVLATVPAWAATLRRSAPTLRFGLVTYLWGRDLSLPTLLETCANAGLDGVELRTTHAHGVEPGIGESEAAAIRSQAEDSGVAIVGLGSNERFDSPDPERVAAAIETTRGFIRASAAVGGRGVKVKPDSFHPEVERQVTIEQIARSLATLGPFAGDLGQEIRLEVHGGCADPAVIAEIVARADHPAVRVCWNSNPQDLRGPGFKHHYDLLRPHFGGTLHVRELDAGDYPVHELVELVDRDGYDGFVLLEAHSPPPAERPRALERQRSRFDSLVAIGRRPEPVPGPVRIAARSGPAVAAVGDGYEVRSGDEPFATLRFGESDRIPSVFPLFAPGRLGVLRTFPFARIEGESEDHPHHRGLWFAHGDVGGHDFWHDPECRIEVRDHAVVDGDTIRFVADWRTSEGTIAVERRTLRFSETPGARRVEIGIELEPIDGELVLGDTKEGSIALRLAPTLRVEGPRARGRLENADGLRDGDCWGRRSRFVMAEGPVDGRLVRVTMTDASPPGPDGPIHWHARKYGLLAANPFGRRAFEGRDAPSGARTISVTAPFRRRMILTLETGLGR